MEAILATDTGTDIDKSRSRAKLAASKVIPVMKF